MKLVKSAAALLATTLLATPGLAEDGYSRESIYVPVRDGTRLALDIWRPDGVEEPLPVVLTMTPYHRARRGADGAVEPDSITRHLLERGYAVAIGDVRGKGASFGSRGAPGGETETNDIGDMIEWLGTREWTNGRVGMHGCSYVGMTVMSGLASQAPHLRAAIVGSTEFDMMNAFTNGGLTRTVPLPDERVTPEQEVARAVPVDADPDGSIAYSTIPDKQQNLAASAIWRSAPFRDSTSALTGDQYWIASSFYSHADAIEAGGVPTFFYGTWFDPFTNDTLFSAWSLENTAQVQIGHGSHCRSPDFDLDAAMGDFFDAHLKNDAEAEPAARYTYYLENGRPGHEWIEAEQFPPADTRVERYSLSGDGNGAGLMLATASETSGSITAPSAPGIRPLTTMGAVRANVDPFSATFTSSPFRSAATLAGIPVVHLNVSAPADDYVIEAYLEAVDPTGYPQVISRGMLAASRRALGDAPYDNGGIPFPSYREADLATTTPNEVIELSFGLSAIARVIRPGERLRLAVTTMAGSDGARIPVTVHYGEGFASAVDVPFSPFAD